jgi:hypothetical protein
VYATLLGRASLLLAAKHDEYLLDTLRLNKTENCYQACQGLSEFAAAHMQIVMNYSMMLDYLLQLG